MGKYDKGVKSYTFAQCELQVAFPEDDVACQWCPFIIHYDSLNRDKCSLTNEILFSRELTGQRCPLTIINNISTEDLKDNETDIFQL